MIESSFKLAVHRTFDDFVPDLYKQPTTGIMYSNGTPDMYYDGLKRDLWAEYKFLKPSGRVPLEHVADLSPLQAKWCERRWNRGKNVVVIVGACVNNRAIGIIHESPAQWNAVIERQQFMEFAISAHEIMEYIYKRTCK